MSEEKIGARAKIGLELHVGEEGEQERILFHEMICLQTSQVADQAGASLWFL